ncbi:MAG: BON domain-containing protein [Gammaproteobacteria bacterium]|nr:MAG: BON domain-containing protein [Gammaproteobacteria bacterium]
MKHPDRTPCLLAATALATCMLLVGCAPLVVGGAAATTAEVAHDRRTAGTVIDDQAIELKAFRAIHKDKTLASQSHISVTSYNLNVLLTGETPTEALRQRAAEIVRRIPRVRRVYNELVVAGPSSLTSRSNDTLITTKVKLALFHIKGLKGFDPTRVKVVTERGNVYLMGLLTHEEADAVAETARRVGGVQRVIKLFEYID